MPTVIVTGSGGLIGSEAVAHFARAGFDVVGIENDMRSRFFGPEASTARTTQRLLEEYPDLDAWQDDYPEWRLEYDLQTTLREIHDHDVEHWMAPSR